jgi:transposase-like protein/IS1 family transposase
VESTCTHKRSQKYGKTKSGEQRYRCLDCGKTFVESTQLLDGMTIGSDKAAHIVKCLIEGTGVRSTSRIVGVSKNTVLDLLVLIGQRCAMFLDDTVVGVKVRDVQADEIWSRVYCSEKTRKRLSLPVQFYGDKYCFTAVERHSKLALAWHVGTRDFEDGRVFIQKLARACGNHDFQITTDGWRSYRPLISSYLGRTDFAQLIKVFAHGQDTGRYSPGQIIEIKQKAIIGNPDPARVCSSHVERANLTMRLWIKRLTRLTMGFSRTLANHKAALGLYFAAYNFVAKHSTIKTSPAVAAGIASEPWTPEELIERTACYNPPTAWERFIDRLPDSE